MKIILVYLIVINLLTFFLFGIDKLLAIRNAQRIPEKNLLGFSFIGGAFGGLLGIFIFRHKVSKPSFLWRFALVFILQFILFAFMRL